MPRAKLNKLYRTFVKGLITEASPLTYPEDASTSELNTVLSRKGNRTRRPGIRYEENYVLNPVDTSPNDAFNEYVWHSVGNRMGLSYVAVQVGTEIHFWAMDDTPLSNNKSSYVINLLDYKAPGAAELDVASNAVHFFSGAGYLFIAHPFCEALVTEYTHSSQAFNTYRVVVQVRDLQGVHDGLANDEEPQVLSKEHHYNLMNQGWVAPGTRPAPALGEGEGGAAVPGTESGGSNSYTDPYTGEDIRYTPGGGGGRFFEYGINERVV